MQKADFAGKGESLQYYGLLLPLVFFPRLWEALVILVIFKSGKQGRDLVLFGADLMFRGFISRSFVTMSRFTFGTVLSPLCPVTHPLNHSVHTLDHHVLAVSD